MSSLPFMQVTRSCSMVVAVASASKGSTMTVASAARAPISEVSPNVPHIGRAMSTTSSGERPKRLTTSWACSTMLR